MVDLSKELELILKETLLGMQASPTEKQDVRDIKRHLTIEASHVETYLYCLVSHKDIEKNKIERISCDRGVPIGGYVYDSSHDCYYISCHDYIPIGYISISFVMTLEQAGYWSVSVPLPERVINRYLSSQQKQDLRRFKAGYSKEQHTFQFLQLLSSD